MKRYCLFFLMCLFSLQVFAGISTSQGNVDKPSSLFAIKKVFQDHGVAAQDAEKKTFPDSDDKDENGPEPVTAGDETLPSSLPVFVSNTVTLAPPLRSDTLLLPPFLPPPARPPRA